VQQPPAYYTARPTNTLAIVSLVFGIVGYVFLPFVAGIVAVVTGHMARGQIKRTGEAGRGFALAGLILGYVNVGLVILAIAVVVVALALAGAEFVQAPQGG
jgi:Domain of unknown function (DUF4190)